MYMYDIKKPLRICNHNLITYIFYILLNLTREKENFAWKLTLCTGGGVCSVEPATPDDSNFDGISYS